MLEQGKLSAGIKYLIIIYASWIKRRAGDTFCGTVLHFLLTYGIDGLDEDRLHEMLTVANAAASLITRVKGALRVMPEISEVEELIKSR